MFCRNFYKTDIIIIMSESKTFKLLSGSSVGLLQDKVLFVAFHLSRQERTSPPFNTNQAQEKFNQFFQSESLRRGSTTWVRGSANKSNFPTFLGRCFQRRQGSSRFVHNLVVFLKTFLYECNIYPSTGWHNLRGVLTS